MQVRPGVAPSDRDATQVVERRPPGHAVLSAEALRLADSTLCVGPTPTRQSVGHGGGRESLRFRE